MGRFVTGSVASSGSLHEGQRLAKPGLPGFNSNSSEHTTQILMGNAISFHGKGNASGQLLSEQGFNIPAASQDAQNQYVTFFDSVEDV
jgi:hypothetical protein